MVSAELLLTVSGPVNGCGVMPLDGITKLISLFSVLRFLRRRVITLSAFRQLRLETLSQRTI